MAYSHNQIRKAAAIRRELRNRKRKKLSTARRKRGGSKRKSWY